jgi:hypothetical protein
VPDICIVIHLNEFRCKSCTASRLTLLPIPDRDGDPSFFRVSTGVEACLSKDPVAATLQLLFGPIQCLLLLSCIRLRRFNFFQRLVVDTLTK